MLEAVSLGHLASRWSTVRRLPKVARDELSCRVQLLLSHAAYVFALACKAAAAAAAGQEFTYTRMKIEMFDLLLSDESLKDGRQVVARWLAGWRKGRSFFFRLSPVASRWAASDF